MQTIESLTQKASELKQGIKGLKATRAAADKGELHLHEESRKSLNGVIAISELRLREVNRALRAAKRKEKNEKLALELQGLYRAHRASEQRQA